MTNLGQGVTHKGLVKKSSPFVLGIDSFLLSLLLYLKRLV